MPKKSKAQLQREESLGKARSTLQALESIQIPDEVPVTVIEDQNDISGSGESDDEEEIGTDKAMDGEITSEGELELFIRTLQDAQNAAQEEERQNNASRKHSKFYTGNSMRSQQRNALNHRQLESEGKTTFITQFFQSSKLQSMQETTPMPHTMSDGPEYEVIERPTIQQQVNEENILQDLEIQRYANRSAKFMDAYIKGLTGAQAAWAAWEYRGHRVLPENILKEMEEV
ncbi:hypothetical protein M422DRAFT_245889 [Sphaerobolus stellatus SS14]|nr:hypothetical protein M422DRAFT_245889 [Sphaerobolus stellatus SS14]